MRKLTLFFAVTLLTVFSGMVSALSASASSGSRPDGGAAATRSENYPQMYEEKPLTLLVMPPINNTTIVEAKEYLYTSISKPLIDAGYYVISPMLAMDILRAESAYDAELFVNSSLAPFQKIFGADAVVFTEINSWTKIAFTIQTNLHYFIKSTRTGEILFDRNCNLILDLEHRSTSSSGWGQLISLAVSALDTMTTDHIEAARKANYYVFSDLPRGKYSDDYLKDQKVLAEEKDISLTIN